MSDAELEQHAGGAVLFAPAASEPGRAPAQSPGMRLKGFWKLYLSPLKLLVFMVSAIFLAETVVMFLLEYFQMQNRVLEALIDSATLVVLLSPSFYYLFYRPFNLHVQEHKKSAEEIRLLSRQLMLAGEEERKRLALDLHDEFGQCLAAMQLDVDSLRDALPAGEAAPVELFGRVSASIADLGDRLRHFSSSLRPPALDLLGVVAAIEGDIDELRARNPGFSIEFQALGFKKRVSPAVEVTLYRLYQECLNNVVRHAGARKVEVRLVFSYPRVIFSVRDDGVGFRPERLGVAGQRVGIGLLGMRERAATLGGSFRVRSAPGEGTLIKVELPAAEESNDGTDG
ncbi:hypothetical protein DESUT3_37710 [Desulfuromonas versatilis]|uniref:Oxygen sensor histidine kinase NreB n=1 Tax=Desulfuromonas versatilis TaxID=2802975 RepID=A0ABM8I019_9BACT|nr:sensor histidine kinase [Desulfuromonas versatilis]BCR06702.1 hypothetical protein DESUT3_37710 [Desulfuromonas versatilis]